MKAGKGLVGALLLAALALSGCAAAPDASQYDLAAGEIAVAPGLFIGMPMEELPEDWAETGDPNEWTGDFTYAGIQFSATAEGKEGKLNGLNCSAKGDLRPEDVERLAQTLNADYAIELVQTTATDAAYMYSFRRDYHVISIWWIREKVLWLDFYKAVRLPLTMEELLEGVQK